MARHELTTRLLPTRTSSPIRIGSSLVYSGCGPQKLHLGQLESMCPSQTTLRQSQIRSPPATDKGAPDTDTRRESLLPFRGSQCRQTVLAVRWGTLAGMLRHGQERAALWSSRRCDLSSCSPVSPMPRTERTEKITSPGEHRKDRPTTHPMLG
jgi:hypothetical protein